MTSALGITAHGASRICKQLGGYLFCVLVAFCQPVIAQGNQLNHAQSEDANRSVASKFNCALNIGTVAVNFDNSSVLVIDNPYLKAGRKLVLVFPEMPQKMAEATILQKTKRPKMTEAGQSAYIIKLLQNTSDNRALAIGILSSKSRFHIDKGCVHANLDGDGFKDTFRIALSQEGAHQTVWSGEPLLGKRKWHGYFHLDYEVEPNATAKDY